MVLAVRLYLPERWSRLTIANPDTITQVDPHLPRLPDDSPYRDETSEPRRERGSGGARRPKPPARRPTPSSETATRGAARQPSSKPAPKERPRRGSAAPRSAPRKAEPAPRAAAKSGATPVARKKS